MAATVTSYNVPSMKYRYKLGGPGATTEFIQLTVDPIALGAKKGHVSLSLDVVTPGDPGNAPPAPGLNDVTVTICVPLTTLSNELPAGVPPGSNIHVRTSSVSWREQSIAPGVTKVYQVDFDWTANPKRKVEVVVRADEVERPIRMLARI